MSRFLLPLLAAMAVCAGPVRAQDSAHVESLFNVEVRVALARSLPHVRLSGNAELMVTAAETGARLNATPSPAIAVRRDARGVRINHQVFPVRSIRVESPDGVIEFDKRRYRGYFVLWDNGRGGFDAVNHVALEDYLRSVVPVEMPKDWPSEALKAQAVAARTYAVFKRQLNAQNYFDVESDVMDQVYGGVGAEDPRADEAVKDTAGMILVHNNQVARAFFHSTCGGKTENSFEVFKGIDAPYLVPVECGYDRDSPQWTWQLNIRAGDVERALKRGGLIRSGPITGLSAQSFTRTGRVRTVAVAIGRHIELVDGAAFRLALGGTQLKSTRFTISRHKSMFIFRGTGYGHGVGMCQWGAKGMAEKNSDFRKILLKYYPGTAIAADVLSSPLE